LFFQLNIQRRLKSYIFLELKQFSQQHSDLQIITLDAHRLYQEARTNPTRFGLTNVLSTCLVGAQSCANPNQYLFWDGIHPTTTAHQIIGNAAYAALENAA